MSVKTVSLNKPKGNASKGAKAFGRISLNQAEMEILKITEENRKINIEIKENGILITPYSGIDDK